MHVSSFDPTSMLIHQYTRAYASNIHSWGQRVAQMRDLTSMARDAAHPPAPNALIRSLTSLTQADKRRAQAVVERALEARIAREEDVALLRRIRPLLQGHYPRVVQALDARVRTLSA